MCVEETHRETIAVRSRLAVPVDLVQFVCGDSSDSFRNSISLGKGLFTLDFRPGLSSNEKTDKFHPH